MSFDELEQAIDGLTTIRDHRSGEVIPVQLDPQEKQAYRQAISQGFLVLSPNPNLLNAYTLHCKYYNDPIITLAYQETFATIELDMKPTFHTLSNDGVAQVYGLFQQYCQFRDPQQPHQDIQAYHIYAACARIRPADAHEVTVALNAIANRRSDWFE